MKQLFLTAVAAFLATSSVWAQHPDGYLTDETRPKQYDFVKAPPSLTSGAFAYDFYYYQWGREQRDSAGVSEQALFPTLSDASPSAAIYDMQGYQLSGKPANGVYIQNGQKFIGK